MNVKQYLYAAFGMMSLLNCKNFGKTGPLGPATLTLIIIPIVGFACLLTFDLCLFVHRQVNRNSDDWDSDWREEPDRRRRRKRERPVRSEGRVRERRPR